MKKLICATIALILICCLTACNSGEKQAEWENTVHNALLGVWVYYDEATNARYTYILDNGTIEQELIIVDDEGKEYNLSLGNSVNVCYRPIAADAIEIYSTVGGKDIVSGTVKFEKEDDNTLILDGVTYIRYEQWVKAHG